MIRLRFLLLLGALSALGCDGDPAEERLRIELGDRAVVDTRCLGACLGEELLSVTIAYPDDFLPQDETVELEQYRVEYDLPDVDGEVPFFAARKRASVAPGEDVRLSLEVAGAAQRDFVFEAVGGETVVGTGTLTLAGYDWDNVQVFIDTEFEVRFGDFEGGGASEP